MTKEELEIEAINISEKIVSLDRNGTLADAIRVTEEMLEKAKAYGHKGVIAIYERALELFQTEGEAFLEKMKRIAFGLN